MQKKVTAILGSVRFWIVTLTAIVAMLELTLTQTGLTLDGALDIVKVWLAAVAGIGTLDSVAEKFGSGAKKK